MARTNGTQQPSPGTPKDEARPTDHQLLERLQKGDPDAATELYRRYAERLRALAAAQVAGDLARCLEADDIVQSVFRSFFRKAQGGLYDVPDGEEIWRLLLVIALNKIRDQHDYHTAAKRDVRQRRGSDAFERLLATRANPDSAADAFLRLVVDEVLLPLSDDARRIVELRIAGHEVAEIAELTSRAKRTVERTLQKFRRELQTTLFEGD